MTRDTISIIISLSDSKKAFTGNPRSPTRPNTIPNTMENTTNPRTFILRAAISSPAGTVSDPGTSSSMAIVKLSVPFSPVTVLLYSRKTGSTVLYRVLFCEL